MPGDADAMARPTSQAKPGHSGSKRTFSAAVPASLLGWIQILAGLDPQAELLLQQLPVQPAWQHPASALPQQQPQWREEQARLQRRQMLWARTYEQEG